jgi:dihydroflavonol-4-reductase
MAELEVRTGRDQGLDAIIVNPTAIAGPYDFKPSFVGRAVLAMAGGRLPALVQGGFDWVDVRDVVAGMVQAERNAPNGAQYLLSGHQHTVVEMATWVTDLTGTRRPWLVAPVWLAILGLPLVNLHACLTGGERLYTRFSLETLRYTPAVSNVRAARELGYKPRPFKETLADTIDWFQENGYLDLPSKRRSRRPA